MVTKATEEVIRSAMPGAKIVKNAGKRTAVRSDSVTPDAGALIRKYGGSGGDVIRSRVVLDAPVSGSTADELEACVVEVNAGSTRDSSVPERLRRRTVIVNKRLGKIVGTSG